MRQQAQRILQLCSRQ